MKILISRPADFTVSVHSAGVVAYKGKSLGHIHFVVWCFGFVFKVRVLFPLRDLAVRLAGDCCQENICRLKVKIL